jgi:heme-degrading monooxygenase HmoA
MHGFIVCRMGKMMCKSVGVWEAGEMVLEVARLDVRPGQEAKFETAMREALPLIETTEGFEGLELRRCVETPNRYLLTVQWRSLEDHAAGFRLSERYEKWRELLHHFYDPFPVVEHYVELPVVGRSSSAPS